MGMMHQILKTLTEPDYVGTEFDKKLISSLFATTQAEVEDERLQRKMKTAGAMIGVKPNNAYNRQFSMVIKKATDE
jgi:5S rRNA maturation endonuclease (ribonuclease M5)